jgi:hypothetical protein
MQNTNLSLEDLILSSRSLTIEEKQDLLKKLDTIPADKKEKMREILTREFESFQKIDAMELSAIKNFTEHLKNITI